MNRPKPAARGDFARTPLAHLLVYALEKRLTGSMEFVVADGRAAALTIIEGQATNAKTSEPVAHLGRVLVELGLISDDVQNRTLHEVAKTKRLHGQILLAQKAITQAQLEVGLHEQLVRKLRHMFSLPLETTFVFFDAFDVLHDYGGDIVSATDPLPVIWRAICESPPWDHVHGTLSRMQNNRLRVVANPHLQRFQFESDVAAAVERIRAQPMRASELTALGLLSPRISQLLVYTLLITKQLEVAEAVPSTPSPSTRHVSAAQRQSPPPPRQSPAPPPQSIPPVSRSFDRAASNPSTGSYAIPKAAAVPSFNQRTTSSTSAAQRRTTSEPSIARQVMPQPMPQVIPPASGSSPTTSASTTGTHSTLASSVAPSAARAAQTTGTHAVISSSAQAAQTTGTHATLATLTAQAGNAGNAGAPARESDEIAKRRAEIRQRAALVDKQDYFEMLGVKQTATGEEVQSAFFALAKKWHPDRLPRELDGVRDECQRVFSRFGEANQTLTDPQRRERYMRLLREGGATPDEQDEIAAVIDAATNFQKAEICLRRNDLAQAEILCRKAYEADRQQADYLAMLAWLESMKPENQTPKATLERVAMLDRAVLLGENCEKAYFYRGMLHKKLSNASLAAKDFRKSADLNPRNVDAVREVRLFEMRKGRVSSAPPQPSASRSSPPRRNSSPPEPRGLLGKLFKK